MQKIFESISFAYRSLKSYRLRALLTMLGISIGIFAITIVFTLVNSMEYSLTKNLSALGNTVMFVHNWPWKFESDNWNKYYNRPKMSWSDYQRLKKNLHNTDAISFIVTKNMSTIKANKRTIDNISIRGVTHDYIKISQFAFQEGRYFSPIEAENGRNVCVLGSAVALSLFDRGPFVGQTVTVDGKPLKVIGVIAKQGKNLFGDNQDEFFMIPFGTFSNMFNINQRRIDKLIAVKSVNYAKFSMVENDVISLMRLNRGLKPGAEDNFSINKQESLMSEMGRFFKYLNTGGVVISIFSLIIGGFGIANIMFVSVRERTKEIGIQKSLGATRTFILLQFLMESVMLCVIGGIIGLIFLFSIAGLMRFAVKQIGMNMDVVILPQDILLALGLSVAIGLISGILPSMMAARLNPVDAMRVS